MSATQFYPLKVVGIDKPIKHATTITFEVPSQLEEAFQFYPGQYLNIKFRVKGKEARRCYSLNSCPYTDQLLQVTVKRVKGGLVSNYVNDQLKVGDTLDVMVPDGRFYASVDKEEYKTYFLFAAGSGITPIFSILQSVLTVTTYSSVYLFYGNKNQNTIIFKEKLDELEKQYPQRLKVVHTLSEPKVWTVWKQWKGRKGRIDPKDVEWFISNHPPTAQDAQYFICGPGSMNLSIRKALIGMDVPEERIHIEQFGGAVEALSGDINAVDAEVSVNLFGQPHELFVPKGQTILEVLKEAKADPPYSCESGVCGSCMAKVVKGKAEMKACMALDDDEVAEGMILTCQALPTEAKVEVIFE